MEQNGVHYHFTDNETFEKMIKENQFIEYAKVNVNMYGTSVDAVKSVLNKGLTVCNWYFFLIHSVCWTLMFRVPFNYAKSVI